MHGVIEPPGPVPGFRHVLAHAHPRGWLRGLGRMLRREAVNAWLGPFVIVAALGAIQQFGMLALLDGRFFDAVSTAAPGRPSSVVIVQRDAAFEAPSAVRFTELERTLQRLGSARIGYLGAVPAASDGVVLGLPARPLPASDNWELVPHSAVPVKAAPAARVLALPEYGINRSQTAWLEGVDGPIASFEAAMAGRTPADTRYLVRMPARQSIPQITASQLIDGQLEQGELDGMLALVADQPSLRESLATPLTPNRRATSEAAFRAHAINALHEGREVYLARAWENCVLLAIVGAVLALAYRRTDAKQIALIYPFALSVLILGGAWMALQFAHKLLPVTALLAAPWLVTFQRVLAREAWQDRRLEESASRAVQLSFRRSALREGARLPQFLGSAARYAGVERSLLFERHGDGSLHEVSTLNASLGDIALADKAFAQLLGSLRGTHSAQDANEVVPSWQGKARIEWLGASEHDLFWLHSHPETGGPGKSAHLVRAIVASFRELFRWRSQLNARSRQEERYLPVDEKVASAIALVANESEQVRHGFDTIDTAVVIFHLIGSPLHSNTKMRELYREAGIVVSDTSLRDALLKLSELGPRRIDAMIADLMHNGGEMRMPMRELGPGKRVLRLASPASHARGGDRVLVLEAIDVSDLHRAADLRQAVAMFIDLQLRNDFEAILLGAGLAGDQRMTAERIQPVVQRIGETARRATDRLDEVAELVRAENSQIVDASYPVDARKVVSEAIEKVAGFAGELGVSIEGDLPEMSGFTVAEPHALEEMLVAMLRVVIADTPQAGAAKLKLEELDGRTHIRVSGGFGIGFGRLMWLLSNYEDEAVGEYRVIGEGMAKAVQWDASVSYWGREADGFGFNIDLRRIG